MTKSGPRFYAVRAGREGPKVYNNWDDALRNTDRFPGSVQKSFKTLQDAEEWISVHPSLLHTYQDVTSMASSSAEQPIAGPSRRVVKRKAQASQSVSQGTMTEHGNGVVKKSRSSSPILADCGPGTAPRHPTAQSASPALASQGPPGPIQGRQAPNNPSAANMQDPAQYAAEVVAAAPKLSDEQRAVLDMVKRGKNVFFTGSAGTGKSVLLREIIKHCRQGHWGRLAITASTGIASVNIGGSTLHSWAGIGLGKEPADKLVGKLLGQMVHEREKAAQNPSSGKKSPAVDKWTEVRTLIIDEISMIDGVLFDKLEYIARALRKNSAPFGGIQLVLSGDFCQLPPVPDRAKGAQQPPTFAFDAESWERCVGKPVILTKVFRQKDQDFVDMLNGMRFGRLTSDTIGKFRALSRTVTYDDGIEPTDLFPTRREVDGANSTRLEKIKEAAYTYHAIDQPGYDENNKPISIAQMERLLERLVAPKTVTLKVGAQVMLIKNLVQGSLVNGSLGRVIDFKTAREAKTQGVDIAATEIQKDRGEMPRIPEWIMQANDKWPLVQFQNGVVMLCVRVSFEVNDADGKIEASRDQLPLILAWALSIHKSQGQTLERVRVNLGRIFEKGQAYVALSRATSMKTLQVLNFDPAKVVAHPRVLTWMEEQTGGRYSDDIDETLEFWADL